MQAAAAPGTNLLHNGSISVRPLASEKPSLATSSFLHRLLLHPPNEIMFATLSLLIDSDFLSAHTVEE